MAPLDKWGFGIVSVINSRAGEVKPISESIIPIGVPALVCLSHTPSFSFLTRCRGSMCSVSVSLLAIPLSVLYCYVSCHLVLLINIGRTRDSLAWRSVVRKPVSVMIVASLKLVRGGIPTFTAIPKRPITVNNNASTRSFRPTSGPLPSCP